MVAVVAVVAVVAAMAAGNSGLGVTIAYPDRYYFNSFLRTYYAG